MASSVASASSVSVLTKEDAEFIINYVDELYEKYAAWKTLAKAYWEPLKFASQYDPKVANALQTQQELAFAEVDRLGVEIDEMAEQFSAARKVLNNNC